MEDDAHCYDGPRETPLADALAELREIVGDLGEDAYEEVMRVRHGPRETSERQDERVLRLESVVRFLFGLLDDVDTTDDIAKGNDAAYRKRVQHIQARRWETGITTDGYTLDLSGLRALSAHPGDER